MNSSLIEQFNIMVVPTSGLESGLPDDDEAVRAAGHEPPGVGGHAGGPDLGESVVESEVRK